MVLNFSSLACTPGREDEGWTTFHWTFILCFLMKRIRKNIVILFKENNNKTKNEFPMEGGPLPSMGGLPTPHVGEILFKQGGHPPTCSQESF